MLKGSIDRDRQEVRAADKVIDERKRKQLTLMEDL